MPGLRGPFIGLLVIALVAIVVMGRNGQRRRDVAGLYEFEYPHFDNPEQPATILRVRPDGRWTKTDSLPWHPDPLVYRDSGWYSVRGVTLRLHSQVQDELPTLEFTVSGDTLFQRTARAMERTQKVTGIQMPMNEQYFVRTSLAWR